MLSFPSGGASGDLPKEVVVRGFPYLIGAVVSLIAGLSIAWLSGSIGIAVVASVAVFLVAANLIREWREHGDEAGSLRSEAARAEARNAARNAAAYSQSSHGGGYFGGCDGGGGGSC